jgi:hypothetical protein
MQRTRTAWEPSHGDRHRRPARPPSLAAAAESPPPWKAREKEPGWEAMNRGMVGFIQWDAGRLAGRARDAVNGRRRRKDGWVGSLAAGWVGWLIAGWWRVVGCRMLTYLKFFSATRYHLHLVIYVISYIETWVCSQTLYFLIYKKWVCPHTTFENQVCVHTYFRKPQLCKDTL